MLFVCLCELRINKEKLGTLFSLLTFDSCLFDGSLFFSCHRLFPMFAPPFCSNVLRRDDNNNKSAKSVSFMHS